jgi:hypothetical protein
MEELGKSFPAAEGMVDAETNTNKPHPNEFCLNCGTKLQDTYCHHCGQKDIPRRQTLGDMFVNFISSFWSFEGKFIQTTKYIFLKPGYLAVEYNKGKRETYFHPARMYVFVSFLFFLLFFSLPDSEQSNNKRVILSQEDKEELSKIGLDSNFNYNDSIAKNYAPSVKDSVDAAMKRKSGKFQSDDNDFTGPKAKTVEQYDSMQAALPESERDGWLEKRIARRVIILTNKYNGDWDAFSADFRVFFGDNFSKVLFYLMPFFALLLKLLYMRRDFYYSEHLVGTIYYYNFFYLAGCVMMLVNLIPGGSGFSDLIGLWVWLYFLLHMKRMYGQGWGKTILKFFIFSFLFTIIASLGVSILAIAALLTI